MADASGSASSGGGGGGGGGAGHGGGFVGGGQQRYQQAGIRAVVHQQQPGAAGQNVHHMYPAGVIHPPLPTMPVQVPLPYVAPLSVAPPPLLPQPHRAQSSYQMPSANETFQDWSVSNNNIAAQNVARGFQDWRMSNGSAVFMPFAGPSASNSNVFYPNLTPASCSINITWPTNNNMPMNSLYTSYPPAIENHQAPPFPNINHDTNSGFAPSFRVDPSFVPVSSFPQLTSSSQCFNSTHQNSNEPTNASKKVKKSDAKEPPGVLIRSNDMETEKSDELLADHTPVSDELAILNQNQNQNHEPFIARFNCREYRLILRKDLTNSDVGNIGRIVLPKRDAEAYLPPLFQREGLGLVMDDFKIPTTWNFKYRFFCLWNLMDCTVLSSGVFVKEHGLQTGDTFIIYKSSESGKFLVRAEKSVKPDAVMPVLECSCKEELNSDEECGFAINLQSRRRT
ncbi:hypothetical protein ABZP36_008068 [Zizania latifolia]